MTRIIDTESAANVASLSLSWNITSHNGLVTVHNPKTGGHRTFRVWTVGPHDVRRTGRKGNAEFRRFPEWMLGRRVVSELTGTDRANSRTWRHFGYVVPGYTGDGSDTVQVWKKLRESPEGATLVRFARILSEVAKGREFGLTYHFEGHCRKCNRPLTHPDSIHTGIGPECRARANEAVLVRDEPTTVPNPNTRAREIAQTRA